MDVPSFLVENLVDTYNNYCQCVLGMSNEEFDLQFFDDDGNTISDLDFIKDNYKQVYNTEVFDSLYGSIVDFGEVREIDLEQVVAFLVSKYYVYNYQSSPTLINYFKNTKLEDIIYLFKTNPDFGIDLIRTYFESLLYEERLEENRKVIYANNDQERLLEIEKKCSILSVTTINDYLRNHICNLYNHYISEGCDDIEALNNTWLFFINGFNPTDDEQEFGVDQATRRGYAIWALRLIYSDLYEDVCNKSIIQSDNYDDRLADMVPLLSIQTGIIGIHAEEGIRNRMLKHFILLQDEKRKKKENRQKTYKDDRVKQLKKVNPLYVLDELTF